MNIEYLNDDEYWGFTINWKRPFRWYKNEKVYLDVKDKKETGIYRIEWHHENQKKGPDNLYIGITFEQSFYERINKHINWLKDYFNYGQIQVSIGLIKQEESIHKRKRYEEIEHVLIYFTQPSENEKKKKFAPKTAMEIKNKGYIGTLPKKITFPVAKIDF
jgi:hypothetical protein